MKQLEKPRIFISKCLGQAHCRYDGTIISSDEKSFFLENIELYNQKRIPFSGGFVSGD